MATAIKVGTEITPVVKRMTQPMIDDFEACGHTGRAHLTHSTHSSPETATKIFGIATPIASGHMTTAFMAEMLRRYFGPEVANHTTSFKLRYTKPTVDGDVITVRGRVTEVVPGGKGTRVNLEVWSEKQNGDRTSIGTASVMVPNK